MKENTMQVSGQKITEEKPKEINYDHIYELGDEQFNTDRPMIRNEKE